jgi:indolepyruvate ferredoxin oxidoreductase
MVKSSPSLNDKFDLAETHQLLTGAQAIVRLVLMQHARDKQAGLNTAGYVSGYRGSPIAGLEGAMLRSRSLLAKSNVVFNSGLNEDIAATAIWGTQQAEMRGDGKYDGVFGIWYGKGPGVDRTGDVFRHANHAGSSKNGGVLALLGDDHTCESSTSAHQSEFAMVDAMIPVLNPAGVQEILDYGLLGIALSRFAGVWVGIKCVKDNIESTATVDGRIDRVQVKIPDDYVMPPGGLNIRVGDQALDKEARLHDYKRTAILAFARANKLDRIVTSGGPDPKIGIITTGKSYLDVRAAMEELGIDEIKANQLGLRLYKVGMPWPLESEGVKKFAEGLDLILVVEEKRALIETQVKEQLFDLPNRPRVLGKKDENEHWLFPAKGALEPTEIALALGERMIRTGRCDDAMRARVDELKKIRGNKAVSAEAATRIPYFCPGCPHNSSTVVPEGSRAYAGIGCHYMAQWMDRSTEGWTHMGGEGANWVGEAPFSKRKHVFQNLGDGTYLHSGSLAIRAAVAAGTNITY